MQQLRGRRQLDQSVGIIMMELSNKQRQRRTEALATRPKYLAENGAQQRVIDVRHTRQHLFHALQLRLDGCKQRSRRAHSVASVAQPKSRAALAEVYSATMSSDSERASATHAAVRRTREGSLR